MGAYIVVILLSYFIGSISFSVIISRKMAGFDVRDKGSGNAGSTNVLRSVGKKAAALTLLCDTLKGVLAVVIAYIIALIVGETADKALFVQLAGFFVILGHTFPIFFEFRGGKGIATALGVLLVTNWNIGLICLVFALVVMAITRMVSLGSIAAAVLFPILVLFAFNNAYIAEGGYFIYSILLAALVLFNHRSNIKRLIEGKENKLSFKKNN